MSTLSPDLLKKLDDLSPLAIRCLAQAALESSQDLRTLLIEAESVMAEHTHSFCGDEVGSVENGRVVALLARIKATIY